MGEFDAAAVIAFLGGDRNSGMCRCPAHDDGRPSLHVARGHTRPLLLHCFGGCSFDAIMSALERLGFSPEQDQGAARGAVPWRSSEERRAYALWILDSTLENNGRLNAEALGDYFANRGIKAVPVTALLAAPYKIARNRDRKDLWLPRAGVAMMFAVTDGRQTVGVHVTWLNATLDGKRDDPPQRQCFGPIKSGYVKLFRGEHDPSQRLLIAEGIETAAAAAQLAGLPAIAALSANNLPLITPPPAAEYVVCGDNDANGIGQQAARALARKLFSAGAAVRVAIPKIPDTDWNNECMSCGQGRGLKTTY
jgi:hypothetical protein